MNLLIKNGRVLDPASGKDGLYDVLVTDGIIAKVAQNIEETGIIGSADTDAASDSGSINADMPGKADAQGRVIDASGCFVMPGLIDLHVHLRDPGLTYKEDIESGAKAAARGGFTTILAMPNTKPVVDCPEVVDYVREKAERTAPIRVLQIGAVTKGQLGVEVADIPGMVKAGIPAISEDGKSVMNAQVYKQGMEMAASLGIPVMAHCEDINLVHHGVVNEDEKARELGLKGITNAVEDVIVARDILLAQETGAQLHLCHCSTRDSVEMLRIAKKKGIRVSGEVCPHHFTLTSDDIPGNDANYKMNPPLRTKEDRDALIQGLRDGTIEVISTDHAPHAADEKLKSMAEAPFGIVGSETAVPLTVTQLLETGVLTPMKMAAVMSYQPAKIAHLEGGTLLEGKPADITIVDPKEEYVIDKNTFVSKGKNTPFDGWKVRGKVKMTICGGRVVYEDDEHINGGQL